MKISVPPSAAILEPVTGASRKSPPCSRIFAANRTLAEGEMVLESTTTAPFCSVCETPLGPNRTDSTALVSETQIQTTSLFFTASAAVGAIFAPPNPAGGENRPTAGQAAKKNERNRKRYRSTLTPQ